MAFEHYELKLIESYGEEVKKGIILPNNSDLSSSKANSKYNKFTNDVIALKPKEYLTSEFRTLPTKDILALAMTIVIGIFGDIAYPYIQEFVQTLRPNGSKTALDGININALDTETGKEFQFTEIPDLNTLSNVTCIVHEFTHYLFRILGIDYNTYNVI